MMDYMNYLEILVVLNDSIAFIKALEEHGCYLFKVSSHLSISNLKRSLENTSSDEKLLKSHSHKEPQRSPGKGSYILGLSQPVA